MQTPPKKKPPWKIAEQWYGSGLEVTIREIGKRFGRWEVAAIALWRSLGLETMWETDTEVLMGSSLYSFFLAPFPVLSNSRQFWPTAKQSQAHHQILCCEPRDNRQGEGRAHFNTSLSGSHSSSWMCLVPHVWLVHPSQRCRTTGLFPNRPVLEGAFTAQPFFQLWTVRFLQ